MKKIKRFLMNNLWIFIAIIDIAMLLMFFWMMFGWILEIAEFHAFMNAYAG